MKLKMGRIGRKLWRYLYVVGFIDELEQGEKKTRVEVYKNKESNREVMKSLEEVKRDCEYDINGNYVMLYDGYIVKIAKGEYFKLLLTQNDLVGFIIYKRDKTYRYIYDRKTEMLYKSEYRTNNIRGIHGLEDNI